MGNHLSNCFKSSKKFDYDVIVIGGGHSGITTARAAVKLQRTVVLIDYSFPNKYGYSWGLGGTSTNVDSVPKRFMQSAINVRNALNDCDTFGWTSYPSDITFNWECFIQNTHAAIEEISRDRRQLLTQENVIYFNAMAEFVDKHTVKVRTNLDPTESGEPTDNWQLITGHKIIIAVGTEPLYLDVQGGREEDGLCITADELMFRKSPPGKSLVIGNGFLAVELSGFLQGMGYETTLLMTSNSFLPQLDLDISYRVEECLTKRGVKVRIGYKPLLISETIVSEGESVIQVAARGDGNKYLYDTYDTIILAVGRKGSTEFLNTEMANIMIHQDDQKIIVNSQDRTTTHSIYAVGSCARPIRQPAPEFWNSHNDSGEMLVKRLFSNSKLKPGHDRRLTYVMSPVECASFGVTEQDAQRKYPREVDVLEKAKIPLEHILPERGEFAYAKVVCVTRHMKLKVGPEVLGIHYFGPYAAEIIQGLAIAMTNPDKRLTLNELDDTVGVYLSCSDLFFSGMVDKDLQAQFEETTNFQLD